MKIVFQAKWAIITLGSFDLYSICYFSICKIFIEEIFRYSRLLLRLLPNTFRITTKYIFNFKLADYLLNRRRDIHHHNINIWILKYCFPELKTLGSVKNFESELWLY